MGWIRLQIRYSTRIWVPTVWPPITYSHFEYQDEYDFKNSTKISSTQGMASNTLFKYRVGILIYYSCLEHHLGMTRCMKSSPVKAHNSFRRWGVLFWVKRRRIQIVGSSTALWDTAESPTMHASWQRADIHRQITLDEISTSRVGSQLCSLLHCHHPHHSATVLVDHFLRPTTPTPPPNRNGIMGMKTIPRTEANR